MTSSDVAGRPAPVSDVAGRPAPVSDVAGRPAPVQRSRNLRIRHYPMTAPTFSMGDNAINPWIHNAGLDPIGVDLSELFKGGGSVKCCTMEVHS
jgi:hypothetical protein